MVEIMNLFDILVFQEHRYGHAPRGDVLVWTPRDEHHYNQIKPLTMRFKGNYAAVLTLFFFNTHPLHVALDFSKLIGSKVVIHFLQKEGGSY